MMLRTKLLMRSGWTARHPGLARQGMRWMSGRVVCGLSGGVDSSLTLALLKQSPEFSSVEAVHMHNWDSTHEDKAEPPAPEENIKFISESKKYSDVVFQYLRKRRIPDRAIQKIVKKIQPTTLPKSMSTVNQPSCWENDWKDATRVAEELGVPIKLIRLQAEYWTQVFEPTLQLYRNGVTPNPDILCNQIIKFHHLFLRSPLSDPDAPTFATGHYARKRVREDGMVELLKARDPSKDQSYFLSTISQDMLKRTIFPVGDMLKSEVRARAEELGVMTAAKKDSVGLCFVGKREFRSFVRQFIEETPGLVFDLNGRILSVHHGLWEFTIGQRISISGSNEKLFVCDKIDEKGVSLVRSTPYHFGQPNSIVVTECDPRGFHPSLLSMGAFIVFSQFRWIAGIPPAVFNGDAKFTCQTRYHLPHVKCKVNLSFKPSRFPDEMLEVLFEEPVHAVTPGQYLALYDGDVCLGSGPIIRPFPTFHELSLTPP